MTNGTDVATDTPTDTPTDTASESAFGRATITIPGRTPGSLPGVPHSGALRPAHLPSRPLSEIADQCGAVVHPVGPSSAEVGEVQVQGITLNSRTIAPGDLYAALPGARTHGARFSMDAARAGAVAILTDAAGQEEAAASGLPLLIVPEPRAQLGDLAAWFYGRPAERMLTFAVTGTNGKTTTTFLLDGAIRHLGRTAGLVGTVEIRVGDVVLPATGTTPEAPDLQSLLAAMVENDVDAVAMEFSSHAIAQHRVDGLTVDVAGFTNLSQDHLDYHHTMSEYFAAKAMLFAAGRAHRAVICVDDEWGRALAERSRHAGVPVTTVANTARLSGEAADPQTIGYPAQWRVESWTARPGGSLAHVTGPDGVQTELAVPLAGSFNIDNALIALVMLVEAGIPLSEASEAVAAAGSVPGRMERVDTEQDAAFGAPVTVVDYAHSPDAVALAVESVATAARPLVVVLGAGGDRDRAKRPLMGRAAAAGADLVIVTDDNPRSEDPASIRAAVIEGARGVEPTGSGSMAQVHEVADRADAVRAGVRAAWGTQGHPGGTVLVLGKGHEQGQQIGDSVLHFDDREVARAAIASVRVEMTIAAGTAR